MKWNQKRNAERAFNETLYYHSSALTGSVHTNIDQSGPMASAINRCSTTISEQVPISMGQSTGCNLKRDYISKGHEVLSDIVSPGYVLSYHAAAGRLPHAVIEGHLFTQ